MRQRTAQNCIHLQNYVCMYVRICVCVRLCDENLFIVTHTDFYKCNHAYARGSQIPVARATWFCTVAPNVCGSSVWTLMHVTLRALSNVRYIFVLLSYAVDEMYCVQIKVKFILEQVTKVRGETEVNATPSLTSALDGVGGQRHVPTICPVPIVQEAGWGASRPDWRVRKISPSTGIRSPDRPACSESIY
jgi:hypothetical protein